MVYHIIIPLFALVLIVCKKEPSDYAADVSGDSCAVGISDTLTETVSTPFVPPADSSISIGQIKQWIACNDLLDSLTMRYADSFKTEDPVTIMRYQDDFIDAQDKVCVRAGLPGGYEEYRWILENMGAQKNRAVLESVNARSF